MTEQNPYQSPATDATAPAGPPLQQPTRSTIPKVFGILHIVIAAIGCILGLTNLASHKILEVTYKTLAKNAGADFAPVQAAIDKTASIAMIDGTIRIILGIFLLVAGIKLLKYKTAGAKLSKTWAIIRMIVAIPLGIMAVGAQKELSAALSAMSDSPNYMGGGAAVAGGVIGILIVCIYPIITLIFMSRQDTKASLTD